MITAWDYCKIAPTNQRTDAYGYGKLYVEFKPVPEHPYSVPSRATAGPGKPLSRGPGPITTAFCRAPRSRRRRRRDRKKETWGFPSHPTRGMGSVISSPSGVRGRAPTESGFYAYFRSEGSRLEHPFQYFERWRDPQILPPNFPHFPPSRRACPYSIPVHRIVYFWCRNKR